ncbi:ATP-binding protein [Pendulispora brunnea]|uniref:ATP-binding protein n=1 Tax=Pendulispora brunnea TaxID=2905690 RepID=A0ABZ2K3R2_9BACT
MAQGVLSRALRECKLTPETLNGSSLMGLYPKLEVGIKLFVEPSLQEKVWAELDALAAEHHPNTPTLVAIAQERDIAEARGHARLLCERMRARPVATERVVTIVSELARNIVNYTPGGQIEMVSERVPRPKIKIFATDRGSGIPNLEEILSGRYRSRTGLGKGITGVKRLSDGFDVQTSAAGTKISVEVTL